MAGPQLSALGLGCKCWLLSFAFILVKPQAQKDSHGSGSARMGATILGMKRMRLQAVRHRASWGMEGVEHHSTGEAQGPGRCLTGEATSNSHVTS